MAMYLGVHRVVSVNVKTERSNDTLWTSLCILTEDNVELDLTLYHVESPLELLIHRDPAVVVETRD